MKQLLRMVLVVFLIKLGLAMMPSFQVDMGAWLAWAERLSSVGFAHFYSDDIWTQYTPGFLYWLWLVGKIGWIQPLAIKIPVIIADMLTGYLIYLVVRKVSHKWASFAYFFYVLNPVVLFDGSIWGQVDGILTLAMFASTYCLVEKKNPYWSWLLTAVSLLIKPQAIAIVPILGLATLVKYGWRMLVVSVLMSGLVILLLYWPFFPQNPIMGLLSLTQKMGVSYPYTSLYAFNLWSYVGMWTPDSTRLWGATYFAWGAGIMAAVFAMLFIKNRKGLVEAKNMYLLFALSCLIFFLFPTRVHERYLFPMFAYLIAYVGIKKQKALVVVASIITVVYSLNLYLPYSYYEPVTNPLKNIAVEQWITSAIPWLASAQLGIFIVLLFWEDIEQWSKHYFQLGTRRKTISQ